MKTPYWMILFLVTVVVSLCALPAQAQRGRQLAKRNAMPGRVVSVDAGRQQVTLALYVKADGPDAPGKVPDDMAREAAKLSQRADAMERQGKMVMARGMRKIVDELLSWREVEQQVIVEDMRLISIRRVSLDQIRAGDMVGTEVSVAGEFSSGTAPVEATLEKDVLQLSATASPVLRVMKGDPRVRMTFLRLIGRVKATDPFTIDADGHTVKIAITPEFQYIRTTPISVREVRPGQRVIARGTAPQASAIHTLIIFSDNTDMPFAPDEDFEV